jgi:hypothetical protein
MRIGTRGKAVRIAALAIGLATWMGIGEARAQVSLEDYDYANLGLRAIGAELVRADAMQTDGTLGVGIRADLGYAGPYVRIVPRASHWKADVKDGEVLKLQEQLQETCAEPCVIRLGTIDRSAWIVGLDAQWVPLQTSLRPYLGAGLDVYFLNDSGDSIRDTFLDDTDITAGLSGLVGLEFDFGPRWRAYGELRQTFVTGATNWNLAAGVAWLL